MTTLPIATSVLPATWYDAHGRVQWTRDARGYLNYMAYDDFTDAVTTRIIDVSPSSGGGASPARSSGLPDALALATTATVDNLGRPLTVTDPAGHVSQYQYSDSNSDRKVTLTPAAGPVQVTDDNHAIGWQDVYTQDANGALLSLTRTTLDLGGRAQAVDRYWDLGGVTYSSGEAVGLLNANYYETTYAHDVGGRLYRVIDPLGTIRTTDYDGLGRVGDIKLGNGSASQVVQTDVHDGGLAGDGNLTQVTEIPGPDSLGNPLPNRVTTYYYDWRDRPVATDNGVRVTYNTLDNLGQATQSDVYASAGAGLGFVSPDGFNGGDPSAPAASALWQRTTYAFDEEGRLAGTTQVSVDRSGGGPVLGPSLMGQVFYDGDGRVIATSSPSGLWTKTVYDGAGRAIDVFQTDGAGGADAATLWRADGPGALVGLDHVFGQTEVTYDAAGNAILTIRKDRLAEDTTSTGPLGDATGQFGDTEGSVSRTSYVARYYDAANRLTDTVDVGTNGNTVWQRPSVVPQGSSSALVSHYAYDAAGQIQESVDANGTRTDYQRDALGRVQMQTENASTALKSSDTNRQTIFGYNGLDEVTSVLAGDVLPGSSISIGTPSLTSYEYGATGSLDQSKLSRITYFGGARESFVYDWLGDVVQDTNRDGTQHHYSYDSLGRKVSDFANNFGAAVDTTVQALSTAYDVLDRPVRPERRAPVNPAR